MHEALVDAQSDFNPFHFFGLLGLRVLPLAHTKQLWLSMPGPGHRPLGSTTGSLFQPLGFGVGYGTVPGNLSGHVLRDAAALTQSLPCGVAAWVFRFCDSLA